MAQQPRTDQSLGELLQQTQQQTATLVRQEIRLAQAELQQKGKKAGLGAGLLGGGGLVALYGLGALIAGIILALATAIAAWAAALIVAAVLFVIAGVLAMTGKKEVSEATPPVPEQAIASTQQDVNEVKERARR
jgi:uncharacterized membrane protein YqjE